MLVSVCVEGTHIHTLLTSVQLMPEGALGN